ncbi:MAG TPA: TolC family protein [Planctomycetota bacterium]|nr:TolC family protein [Planctomycetota bacterium]
MSATSALRRAALVAAAAFIPGCASADADGAARSDREAFAADVATRAGVRPPLDADDAASSAALRELLARPWTEDAAVRAALVAHRGVRAAYESLGVASADWVSAGLVRNPRLDLSAKFFSPGTEIESEILAPLFDLVDRAPRLRRAEAMRASAATGARREVVARVFDVREAWTRWHAARRLAAARLASAHAAADAASLAERLHAAGNVAPATFSAAQVAAARLRLAAAEAAAEVDEFREELNAAAGLWGADAAAWGAAEGGDAEVAASRSSGPGDDGLDDVEARAIAASLDLAARTSELDLIAQEAGRAARDAVFAEAELGVAFKREPGGESGFGPGASIPIPLFDAGAAATAAGEARLRAAVARRHVLAVEIRAAARRLRERVLSAEARAAFVRDAWLAAAARRTVDVLQEYNAMQIGALDVLEARRAEIDAQAATIVAERDARLARLALERLLAGVYMRPSTPGGGEAASGHDAEATPSGKGH